VNGIQIKILNFLAKLPLTPVETMPMSVNRKGHQMALHYGTYSEHFTDKTTQGWKGLHQWSTQFKVFFAFLHIIFFYLLQKTNVLPQKLFLYRNRTIRQAKGKLYMLSTFNFINN
jgi:hypothetical protein